MCALWCWEPRPCDSVLRVWAASARAPALRPAQWWPLPGGLTGSCAHCRAGATKRQALDEDRQCQHTLVCGTCAAVQIETSPHPQNLKETSSSPPWLLALGLREHLGSMTPTKATAVSRVDALEAAPGPAFGHGGQRLVCGPDRSCFVLTNVTDVQHTKGQLSPGPAMALLGTETLGQGGWGTGGCARAVVLWGTLSESGRMVNEGTGAQGWGMGSGEEMRPGESLRTHTRYSVLHGCPPHQESPLTTPLRKVWATALGQGPSWSIGAPGLGSAPPGVCRLHTRRGANRRCENCTVPPSWSK